MKRTWIPCAMRALPNKNEEAVAIVDIGSDSNGDSLYSVESFDGGPATMTAAQWANLGIILCGGDFDSLPVFGSTKAAPRSGRKSGRNPRPEQG